MKLKTLAVLLALISVGCRAESPTVPAAPTTTTTPVPSTEASLQPMPTPSFGHAKVLIDTDEGSVIIDAETAETDEQRQFGYMFREEVGPDEGMVFLWGEEHSGGFWMKNVKVPLSIAFFDGEGIIVAILDMEPCTKEPCEIYDPLYDNERAVTYHGALEVRQGAFEEWGVEEGDRITVTR